MSNSSLVTYTNRTRHHSGQRTHPITKIAIHHMYAVWTAKQCVDYFANTEREVSSNYAIGYDGSVGLSVDECNRAWTTASSWCDNRAVTIEVSNISLSNGCPISDASLNSLIILCVDICTRNNIYPCTYTGDKSGTLQLHKWYVYTSCPGAYLESKMHYIAKEVTRRLTENMKAKQKTGWIKDSTGWWYKEQDGSYIKNAWKKDRGKWYYFDDKGYMLANQIKQIKGKWYAFNLDGAMLEGALNINKYGDIDLTTQRGGVWLFNAIVNIRRDPSTRNPRVAYFKPGQAANILDTLNVNGTIWGYYLSQGKYHRYVCLIPQGKDPTGKWI